MAYRTFTLKRGGPTGGIIPLPDGTRLTIEPGEPFGVPEEFAERFADSADFEEILAGEPEAAAPFQEAPEVPETPEAPEDPAAAPASRKGGKR